MAPAKIKWEPGQVTTMIAFLGQFRDAEPQQRDDVVTETWEEMQHLALGSMEKLSEAEQKQVSAQISRVEYMSWT